MVTNLQDAMSLTSVESLFKIDFKQYYENSYNTLSPFWGSVRRTNDFTGKKMEFPAPLGYQGGVGSGSLPEANHASYGDVQVTSKKIYAVSRIDRESIMASLSDKGAFVKLLAEAVKKTTEADNWNHARMAFGTGDGALGTIDSGGVTDNGGGSYSLVISSATWKEANFEEKMFVNIETGNTDLFEITEVVASTRTVTVQRQSGGSQIPAATDEVFLQGSEDNDIDGLGKVLLATNGTLYNVTVSRRWKAYQMLSYGAALTPQAMNKLALGIEKQCGKAPKIGVTSYKQYEILLNQLEDQKRYTLTSMQPRNMKGSFSFEGVQFMSSQGPIKIFPDKFCEEDRLYFLNPDFIAYHRRPNSGWVKEDIGGNGYLRVVDEDQFEARHATYGQLFIAPPFHGVITGLTVPA